LLNLFVSFKISFGNSQIEISQCRSKGFFLGNGVKVLKQKFGLLAKVEKWTLINFKSGQQNILLA